MKKIFALIIIAIFIVILFFNDKKNYIVYIENVGKNEILSGNGIVYKFDNNKYYIVTNYHVIALYNDIYVYNNKGKKVKAVIEKFDDYIDIAILSVQGIKLDKANLTKCNYNINDNVKILGKNINKKGIIEKDNIKLDVPNIYGNSIYNTFKINYDVDYGDSGSAVIDKSGDVIGIVSVMDLNEKKGYAMPICDVAKAIDLLMSNQINRPDLKARFSNSNSNIAGVLVLNVFEGSILENMGVQKGDIIVKLNDSNIQNISDFRNELYKYSSGDSIKLIYYRDNSYFETIGTIK